MIENRAKKLHLLITILIMAFIFLQSAFPADLSSRESNVFAVFLAGLFRTDAERIAFAVRKCAHFTEYLALGISLLLTVKDYIPRPFTAASAAWCLSAAFAVSDEWHQHFVPGRSCELRDVIIDSCGAAVGVLLALLLQRLRQRRRAE